jgi:hypothetical protein
MTTASEDFTEGMEAAFDALPHWEHIPEADYDESEPCGERTSALGVEPVVICTRTATRRKLCSGCNQWMVACVEHGVDDLSDLDLARLKKQLLPSLLQYAEQASAIEQHARAADAERRQAFTTLGDQIYATIIKMVGAPRVQEAIDKVVKIDGATIALVQDGEVKLVVPRGQLPGETSLDLIKQVCRVGVEMIAGAAHGMGYGLGRLREEHRPTVLVQVDDFGAAADEHHALVSKHMQIGTAAEFEALNTALRTCARPARAFRKGDLLEAYATDECHRHDHGAP